MDPSNPSIVHQSSGSWAVDALVVNMGWDCGTIKLKRIIVCLRIVHQLSRTSIFWGIVASQDIRRGSMATVQANKHPTQARSLVMMAPEEGIIINSPDVKSGWRPLEHSSVVRNRNGPAWTRWGKSKFPRRRNHRWQRQINKRDDANRGHAHYAALHPRTATQERDTSRHQGSRFVEGGEGETIAKTRRIVRLLVARCLARRHAAQYQIMRNEPLPSRYPSCPGGGKPK